MKKILNFLLVTILAMALISCNYVSGESESESKQVDRKEYTVNVVYKESAAGAEKTEPSKFSLEVGKSRTISLPEIESEDLIGWTVNGEDAEESANATYVIVERTANGAKVTLGETTFELAKDKTEITVATKYEEVDVYELSFSYSTSLNGTVSTENKTVQLTVGSMDSVTLPVVDVESGEVFNGWTVNGELAENSANATTVTISRTETGIQVVLGGSTFTFDADQTTIEFATQYEEQVIPPEPVYDTYELAFVYKTSLDGNLSTSAQSVELTVGDTQTVTLPVVEVEENQTFNGWTVNGRLAQNSANATTLTISRNENGVQVVLGESTYNFNEDVVRIEFTTQYGQPITPPPVTYVTYSITVKYQTSPSSATITDTQEINLEVGQSRTIYLPDISNSEFEGWKIEGEFISSSAQVESITITRTDDGIIVTLGNTTKTYDESKTTVIFETKFDEGEWTGNY